MAKNYQLGLLGQSISVNSTTNAVTFSSNLIVDSAYSISLNSINANGTIGSEGQVLASDGTKIYWTSGGTGYNGSVGFTGSAGADGYTGSQGEAGYVGSAGVDGYTGSSGADGYVGSQGDIGYTGSAGAGFTGSVGFTGSSGGILGDPYYGQTSLTLHFNNTNSNTLLTYDTGPKGVNVTLTGSAILSNTQFKFGNSSLLVSNGTAGRAYTEVVTRGSPLDLATGNTDFTVEAWAYPRAIPASGANEFSSVVLAWGPVGFGAGYASISIALTSGGAWSGQWNSDNTGPNDRSISGNTASLNTWSHVAFTKQGNTFRIFVNGNLISNSVNTTISPRFSSDRWVIGSGTNSTYKFDGFIDDVRITKGVARYTANFTAPTTEHLDFYAIQGYTGSIGSQGELGYSGSIGFTGSTGAGFTGSQGNLGYTGSKGEQGIQGVLGYVGSQGDTGFVGSQGAAGDTGFVGSKGDIGFTGSIGIGYAGSQGDIGYTGSKGNDGTFGGAAFEYFYSTNTTNSEPGVGYLRFNNTTFSSANEMYISFLDEASANVFNFLQTIDDSTSAIKGHFTITDKANTQNYALFSIVGNHAHLGQYFEVPVSYTSGATSFTDNLNSVVTFARTGDIGDTGYTGSQGDIGYTGSVGVGYTGSEGTGFTGSQGSIGYTGSAGSGGGGGSYTFNVNTATTFDATLSWDSNTYDMYIATAQNANVTINADSGSPTNGKKIMFRIKDNGTAINITWSNGVSKGFRNVAGSTLPFTTVANKTLYVGAIYNSDDQRWDIVATSQEL
jgi:hypothetical protein